MHSGGSAKIPTGKTSHRLGVLSLLTMELLNKLDKHVNIREGVLFGFNSAHSLRVNLERHIKQLQLPNKSSVDVMKW